MPTKKYKLTLLFLLFSYPIFCQNFSGQVLDLDSNQPLKNVNVFISSTVGTTTNKKGEFNFSYDTQKCDTCFINFSYVGYETRRISTLELKKEKVVIYLLKKTDVLKQIIIYDEQKLNNTLPYKKVTSIPNAVYNFGSFIKNDEIYISSGDASHLINSGKKALEEANLNTAGTFEDILKELSKASLSWEIYSDELQVYNLKEDVWKVSKHKFIKRAYHEMVNNNGKIYIVGGKSLSTNRKIEYLVQDIEILDIVTDRIVVDHTNPHQAINFTCITYSNYLFLIGGSTKLKPNGDKVFTKKNHVLDLNTGLWYELKNMLSEKEVNGILINDKIYLVGGFNNEPLSEIESYNFVIDEWLLEEQLFSGFKRPALASINQLLYIFENERLISYDIKTKEMLEYKINLPLEGANMYFRNNKLYIFGGSIQQNFEKYPNPDIYEVNIDDLLETKINNSKNIQY